LRASNRNNGDEQKLRSQAFKKLINARQQSSRLTGGIFLFNGGLSLPRISSSGSLAISAMSPEPFKDIWR
jgi:hypothetical protein